MSNTIILRRVFALDSNTGNFLSSGQVLLTNNIGGTSWTDIFSTLVITGGTTVGYLPSTINTQSTVSYSNTSSINQLSSIFLPAICSMSIAIASQFPGQLTAGQLVSSVAGLGNSGYVSTSALQSSIVGAQAYTPTSASSMSSIATSLASFGYTSTASLTSSIAGLGISYPSTLSLVSSIAGLGQSGYISSLTFNSTIVGLGTLAYVSTASLVSTTASLFNGGQPTSALISTTGGLGTAGYISSLSLISSVTGLGTSGYVSTFDLVSTTIALSTLKTNIRFDNTGAVIASGSINYFTGGIGNIIYVSTFFTSSLQYSGNNLVPLQAKVTNNSNLTFSTATLNLGSFSNYINSNTLINVDVIPQIAFSKLATGATNVAILPISSFLQYGLTNLYSTTVNNYIYIGNTYMIQSNGASITYTDASNFFNTPIKMSIPPGTVNGNYASNYTVVHYMPGGLNYTPYTNALHNATITPYFGSTGSLFVSVQNVA